MHRDDKSNYLLFIEPQKKEKLNSPIEDELVNLVEMAIGKSKSGVSGYGNLGDNGSFNGDIGYKGFHRTECGENSGSQDLLLENGMITNSLAPFYLKWYRNSIPETDIEKLMSLKQYYINNI